jgi:hypothetical protein
LHGNAPKELFNGIIDALGGMRHLIPARIVCASDPLIELLIELDKSILVAESSNCKIKAGVQKPILRSQFVEIGYLERLCKKLSYPWYWPVF